MVVMKNYKILCCIAALATASHQAFAAGETLPETVTIDGEVITVSPKKIEPTLRDVAYGPYERNKLDFWQAESAEPTPVVFYIHGGGWLGGSKEANKGPYLNLLENGVSYVSINYRLARGDNTIPCCLDDAARALQFVRSKAEEWNIDPERIVATGGSAGGCSSLWLAYHDDPPVYMEYDPGPPAPPERDGIHHVEFGRILQEHCKALGVSCEIGFNGKENRQVALDAFMLELLTGQPAQVLHPQPGEKPNILILYADDLGFGDLSSYNPESKIPTPHLDRLAEQGMRFTDAHSSSGICTPSRYAMLTGQHHWRKFNGIVSAFGPSVFDEEELTLAEMLQSEGYLTAIIGKWHLGWDWDAIAKPGAERYVYHERGRTSYKPDALDWSQSIPDGPLAHGFDYYFGDTVINFPPYAWIENDRVIGEPDRMVDASLFGEVKEGTWEARPGPMVAGWDPYENIPTTTEKAITKIHEYAAQEQPFFMLFSFPSPHAPIIPADEFDGRSNAGPYGDYVVQTDEVCGELIAALEAAGVSENTIVIFTADNGPEFYAYERDEKFDHWSSEPLRGAKRDIYEGGHRVPYIVKWPGVVEEGSVSEALISQIDLMATLAGILGLDLPVDQAVDSYNQLPVLSGAQASVRDSHVHNTFKDHYAIRQGDWVLIDAEMGYTRNRPELSAWETRHGYPEEDDLPVELYNLSEDIGQYNNLAAQYPEKVAEMQELLQKIRAQGYSAPRLSMP